MFAQYTINGLFVRACLQLCLCALGSEFFFVFVSFCSYNFPLSSIFLATTEHIENVREISLANVFPHTKEKGASFLFYGNAQTQTHIRAHEHMEMSNAFTQ